MEPRGEGGVLVCDGVNKYTDVGHRTHVYCWMALLLHVLLL